MTNRALYHGASSNAASNLVLDGGRLLYMGGVVSIDRLFTLTQNGGTLTLANSGNVAFSGSGARTLTLGGTNTDQNTLAAGLGNGSGGATGLTKTGAGRWVLTGSLSYTGGTLVLEGTLTLPSPTTPTPISQNPQVVKDVSTTFKSVSRAVTVKVALPSQVTQKTAPAVLVTVMGVSVSGAPSAINALTLPTGVEGVNTAPTLSGAPSPAEGTPSGPALKKKKTEQETEGTVTPEGLSPVEKGNP
ncbi:MAG: autotransporter-associated beta strand repeat-containing protein [Nitrospirae bacterium]|nr:autotransporter-associated beta strand repeat-containing protein [Nitrospirota bacterium]